MSHLEQFQHLKIKLKAIKSATNNFSGHNCIGKGGFGRVYKGKLLCSMGETMVAMKRLDEKFEKFGQGNSEFWKEIMFLSLYKHENIINLLGYCDDHGDKILVYEYASKKSLDSYLASEDLTWVQRLRICIGAARGLAYLHNPGQDQQRILHRDIKSSNVLLDDNWNAKISDFGLSKLAPANKEISYVITNPAGTHYYIDPSYQETGILTKESDVYSFGVVLFEVLCGRLCFGDKNHRPLIGLVREYYLQNKISDLVYSEIEDQIDISSVSLFAKIAYLCLKRESEERPLMTQVVSALESALDTQEKADAKAKEKEMRNRAGILHVKVIGTTDATSESLSDFKKRTLRIKRNPFKALNLFLVLCIDDTDSITNIKATAKYNEMNAEWNEEFTLNVKHFHTQNIHIHIHVNQVVRDDIHRRIGEVMFKLHDLIPEILWTYHFCVTDKKDKDKDIGHLIVEMLYRPTIIDEDANNSVPKAPIGTPNDGGLLVIIIKGARLYSEKVDIESSVALFFRGDLIFTEYIEDTNTPMWLQEFTFILGQPPTDESLRLKVRNSSWKGLIPGLGSFGEVKVGLADVVNRKWTNETYELDRANNFILVELQWRTSVR